MQSRKKVIFLLGAICAAVAVALVVFGVGKEGASIAVVATLAGKAEAQQVESINYERERWDPVHFKPAIDTASDEQCLSCHQEVIQNTVRAESPAGVKAADSLAWYQTLDTYEGEQATFHWRHLKSPYATQVMQMKCNTCHQGNDPRDKAVNPPDERNTTHVLRKNTNPDTCLLCHGKFPAESMSLPAWPEIRDALGNDCLSCHTIFRTTRHQVNYLKPEAIETLAKEQGGDVCYGCHGGRQWYRISFPYPRHAWEGMEPEVPEWAKDRPAQSEARFLTGITSNESGSKP
uniref:hypothetical protein n=1 Tax=Castellaniella defragrans TaxID=75697 RepID=UPI0033410E34